MNLLNEGLWILLTIICLAFIFVAVRKSAADSHKAADSSHTPVERTEINEILGYVKNTLHEITRGQLDDYGLSEEEFYRRRNQRTELKQALKGCVTGDLEDKQLVKAYISDLLELTYRLTPEELDRVIPFERFGELSVQDQFDIILFLYKQEHGVKALAELIEQYRLDEARVSPANTHDFYYEISTTDISRIFMMVYRKLEYKEKLEIVVQRIYQLYKGFSVIDEIRDQQIDGVSGGVSGIPEEPYGRFSDSETLRNWNGKAGIQHANRAFDSVWIFFKGKTIRLSFLSFGTASELKRVCQNIYKYNLPGQLSEASAYKVNEMKDGSRVVVVRPPFAESWAFFIRKFDFNHTSLGQLIKGEGADLVISLLSYLMKGSRITAITGSQGSGKTTLLMALVEYIYSAYTLRIQEMSFELHLRRLYPERNILSFRETDYISGQQGLDLQKKTDGTVNILGEVATDEVAAWMVQMAQVASLFTLFTHHAKTFDDLVDALRNSLLKTGVFRSEEIAKRQVIRAVNFDVHLRHDMNGERYIERITECLPDNTSESGYSARNIVEFKDGKYVAAERLSPLVAEEMKREMHPADARQFVDFMSNYWGGRVGA